MPNSLSNVGSMIAHQWVSPKSQLTRISPWTRPSRISVAVLKLRS